MPVFTSLDSDISYKSMISTSLGKNKNLSTMGQLSQWEYSVGTVYSSSNTLLILLISSNFPVSSYPLFFLTTQPSSFSTAVLGPVIQVSQLSSIVGLFVTNRALEKRKRRVSLDMEKNAMPYLYRKTFNSHSLSPAHMPSTALSGQYLLIHLTFTPVTIRC